MADTTAGFQASDAVAMLTLADAAYNLSNFTGVQGWNPVGLVSATGVPGAPQGFVAFGALPSSGQTVAVLAFGWDWTKFLEGYQTMLHLQAGVPTGLFLKPPPTGPVLCDLGYTRMYNYLRASIWAQVVVAQQQVPGFATNMPLIVTGHGPSAPLAQLAAADLAPGKVQGGQSSPVTSISTYAFSCPAFGNAAFASALQLNVPNALSVNLATDSGVPVDIYPTLSAADANYALAGVQVGASARIPEIVCPWFERESYLYTQTLNGAQVSASVAALSAVKTAAPVAKIFPEAEQETKTYSDGVRDALAAKSAATINSEHLVATAIAANGYDPILAYSLTQLCSFTYQQFQFPTLVGNLPVPYSLVTTFNANGVVWGALYQSPAELVIAFRGPATFSETISLFGSNIEVQPNWFPKGTAKVLQSYAALYQQLGPAMRTALAKTPYQTLKVYCTGHCVGGALASLALHDLVTTPLGNGQSIGGVYSFGAPPVGNIDFQTLFQNACGSLSNQVVRPADIIPQIVFSNYGVALPLGRQVQLSGGDTDLRNGFTYHTLVMYSSLLNPRILSAPASMPAAVRSSYTNALASTSVPWNEVNKCVLDTADSGGKIVLSWNKAESFVGASQYAATGTAKIGVQDVVVQPGHELSLEAPPEHDLHVVAQSIQLGPGSRLTISPNAQLSTASLTAVPAQPGATLQAPPSIVVLGANGPNGMQGPAGMSGSNGAPGQYGGPGGNGGSGSHGGSGGNSPVMTVAAGAISGVFHVLVSGGQGGAGGNGGNGGNGGAGGIFPFGAHMQGGRGGNGGPGGNGGDGGNGSVVTITYTSMEVGTNLLIETPAAPGGAGGAGGAPGNGGGNGAPSGAPGTAGTPGKPGTNGSVAFIKAT